MTTVVSLTIDPQHITGALVNQHGQLSASYQVDTPTDTTHETLLQVITEVCSQVIGDNHDPLGGVGISIAAPVDRHDNTVRDSGTLTQLAGIPLVTHLQSAFDLPVVVINDVNAMALLEVNQGVAQNAETTFYIFVDHEINGAIVQNGEIWHGTHSSAGEISYLVTGWMGTKPITLGQRASGVGIANEYNMRSRKHRLPNLDEILQYAKQGDHLAIRVLRDGAHILGSVLRPVMNLIDPTMVVVGGRLASNGDLWWENFEVAFHNTDAPSLNQTQVVRAKFTENAALLGAAFAIRNHLKTNI